MLPPNLEGAWAALGASHCPCHLRSSQAATTKKLRSRQQALSLLSHRPMGPAAATTAGTHKQALITAPSYQGAWATTPAHPVSRE